MTPFHPAQQLIALPQNSKLEKKRERNCFCPLPPNTFTDALQLTIFLALTNERKRKRGKSMSPKGMRRREREREREIITRY